MRQKVVGRGRCQLFPNTCRDAGRAGIWRFAAEPPGPAQTEPLPPPKTGPFGPESRRDQLLGGC
jgi:hypothetical protein